MAYTVTISRSAAKDIRALDDTTQRRVAQVINALADNPRPPGVQKLSAVDNVYRLRSGDYHVLYQIVDRHLLVLVVRVRHRREVYR
jgi:mRNA interferase RelE/StbE